MTIAHDVEIAVVGGGPAGAAVAARLAGAGREVIVFERWPEPRWRASGVFCSPRTRVRLASLGLDQAQLHALIRPISALTLETLSGSRCRLEYPAPHHACGVDRVRLERALLAKARSSGAEIRESAVVRSVALPADGRHRCQLEVSETTGVSLWRPRLVVGADGPRSIVARAAGVVAGTRLLNRAGVTFHRADPGASVAGSPMEGRFVFGTGWYVGIAPVPGDRVNIGLVLDAGRLRPPPGEPARPIGTMVDGLLDSLPPPPAAWQSAPSTDSITVSLPLAHRVHRAAGPGFVLVGDAAGFVDPLTGDGLHRALASAELAAAGIDDHLHGDTAALSVYDQRLRARFRNKDIVSWVLQVFLAQPSMLGYAIRRLSGRDDLRATFTAVMTDTMPASRVLDPRFISALLVP